MSLYQIVYTLRSIIYYSMKFYASKYKQFHRQNICRFGDYELDDVSRWWLTLHANLRVLGCHWQEIDIVYILLHGYLRNLNLIVFWPLNHMCLIFNLTLTLILLVTVGALLWVYELFFWNYRFLLLDRFLNFLLGFNIKFSSALGSIFVLPVLNMLN